MAVNPGDDTDHEGEHVSPEWYMTFDWSSLPGPDRPQGGGRQPKYQDPEVMYTLLKHIEEGLPVQDACRLAGISPTIFYEWRAAIPAIAEAIKAAESKLKATMLAHVRRAAPANWAAAMTLLERRFPEDFGRRDRVRHEHAGQVGLTLAPAQMDPEAALLAADLEAKLAEADDRRLLPAHEAESED